MEMICDHVDVCGARYLCRHGQKHVYSRYCEIGFASCECPTRTCDPVGERQSTSSLESIRLVAFAHDWQELHDLHELGTRYHLRRYATISGRFRKKWGVDWQQNLSSCLKAWLDANRETT